MTTAITTYSQQEPPPRFEAVLNKPLPSNDDAERAILGAVLIDNGFMAIAADTLRPEHFYSPFSRAVYSAMLTLFDRNKPIDPIEVAELMKRDGDIQQFGGAAAVANLTYGMPMFSIGTDGDEVRRYAERIRDLAQVRRLVHVLGQLQNDAVDEGFDPKEMLERAATAVNHIATAETKRMLVAVAEVGIQIAQNARDLRDGIKPSTGLFTGFRRLDHITNGLQKSDLIVVGGRPGMGKSAFAGQLALSAARFNAGAVVAIFSLEMSKEQYVRRLISNLAEVPELQIKSGMMNDSQIYRVDQANVALADMGLFIDDSSSQTGTSMRSQLLRLQHERKRIDLVIVDYVQRMTSSHRHAQQSRQQEVSRIAQDLKTIAKDFDVPVLALSSMSRANESRAEPRPKMSDLRDSGDIESEADIVALMYRPGHYDEAIPAGNTELIIDKNRHGPTETIKLRYAGNRYQFVDEEWS